jgi:hypothetical protein
MAERPLALECMGEWILSLTPMVITHLTIDLLCTRSTCSDVKPVLQYSRFGSDRKFTAIFPEIYADAPQTLAAIRRVSP